MPVEVPTVGLGLGLTVHYSGMGVDVLAVGPAAEPGEEEEQGDRCYDRRDNHHGVLCLVVLLAVVFLLISVRMA